MVKGHAPRNARETSLDQQTSDRSGVKIGDRLEVTGERRARSYRVVGITKLGSTSFGGASIAQLTLPEAQRVTDKAGRFDQISLAARHSPSAHDLRDRVRAALPPSVRVRTRH